MTSADEKLTNNCQNDGAAAAEETNTTATNVINSTGPVVPSHKQKNKQQHVAPSAAATSCSSGSIFLEQGGKSGASPSDSPVYNLDARGTLELDSESFENAGHTSFFSDEEDDENFDDSGGVSSAAIRSGKAIDCLHLIMPLALVPVRCWDPEERPKGEQTTNAADKAKAASETPEEKLAASLRGYVALKELREHTSQFRLQYLNWRKHKPKGAKGEAHDAIVGKTTQPVRYERARSVGRRRRDAGKRRGTEGELATLLAETTPPPDVLVDGVDAESRWLRFYFNPFVPPEEKRALPLNASTLPALKSLARDGLTLPNYSRDPATVNRWIMHLGVGQFHRSHQLVYLDDLLSLTADRAPNTLNENSSPVCACREKSRPLANVDHSGATSTTTTADKWGYCGVGLMPFDAQMAELLRPQDLLYAVLTRSNQVSAARVIGSMLDYIFAPSEPRKAFERLIDPALRIVSLTVTEKGYCQSVDNKLDTKLKLVQSDLALLRSHSAGELPVCPSTAIGFLVYGLRERKARGVPPFTVMSCDNLPGNGTIAKKMVVAMSEEVDKELAEWISSNVAFPSTMVDRITPATAAEHKQLLEVEFGIQDSWPVVAEEFRQWVVEDDFPQGRPRWELVGTLLCQDVRPFELMKLRLLNGGHSMLCYAAYLAGYRFVDDAVNDILLSSFLRAYMDEVTSTIKNVSVELERYKEKIVERFGNRMMKDTLLRLCEDGSTKFFNTLKDCLHELIAEEKHVHWACFGLGAFIVFLGTVDSTIVKDGRKDLMISLAKNVLQSPADPLTASNFIRAVFGEQLASHRAFVHTVTLAVYALARWEVGTVLRHGGVLETLLRHKIVNEIHEMLAFCA